MSTPEQCRAYRARKRAENRPITTHEKPTRIGPVAETKASRRQVKLKPASAKKVRAIKRRIQKAGGVEAATKAAAFPLGETTRAVNTTGKGITIINLIARPEGATMQELVDSSGWQKHTIRGYVATQKTKQGRDIYSENGADGTRRYFERWIEY